MIASLKVSAKSKVPVAWWDKAFQGAQSWEFKPGVNILWGPNGSGKSTILTLLARLHCCEHTGYSKVTKLGFDNLFRDVKPTKDGSKLPSGIECHHDGQEIRCFNSGKVIGMEFGSAAFDFEVDDPVGVFMTRGSSGQLNVHRLGQVMKAKPRDKIEWTRSPDPNYQAEPGRRDHHHEKQMWLQDYLKGSLPAGPRTFLMDEPDVGMDWPTKRLLWDLTLATSGTRQYIVASHSIFAMQFPGANFIEMKPGYLEECRKVVRGLTV
jgi:predicted ATPase